MSAVSEMPSPARVFMIGKDRLVSRALARLFELDSNLTVIGDAATLATAAIADKRPDVVVLDATGQQIDATGARAYLQRVAPSARMTLLNDLRFMNVGEMIESVKKMGLAGSLARPHHLRVVSNGAAAKPEPPAPNFSVLSERELEVVRLVAEGLSNKEISSRLSLSDKTVKNHISHILAKVNLSARTQVAIHAIRAGLV